MTFPLAVPKAGVEPARPKAHDFESCASTNSATQASFCPLFFKRVANMRKVWFSVNGHRQIMP